MTPTCAARLAAHGRRLRAAKLITVHTAAVLDALLWRLRRPGRADLEASYRQIARLAGVCRQTAIAAVAKLVAIGLLAKTTRRIRVRWGHNRAQIAVRQARNVYRFLAASTGSTPPAVIKGIARPSCLPAASTPPGAALEGSLRALQRAMGLSRPDG